MHSFLSYDMNDQQAENVDRQRQHQKPISPDLFFQDQRRRLDEKPMITWKSSSTHSTCSSLRIGFDILVRALPTLRLRTSPVQRQSKVVDQSSHFAQALSNVIRRYKVLKGAQYDQPSAKGCLCSLARVISRFENRKKDCLTRGLKMIQLIPRRRKINAGH